MRVALLLVEGETERVLYTKLMEKLYGAQKIELDQIPKPVNELLEPLNTKKARKGRITALKVGDVGIVVVNCGGFEEVKTSIRMLLKRRVELLKAVESGLSTIIVAADLDKDPMNSIRGVLASQRIAPRIINSSMVIDIEGRALVITVIVQGYYENTRRSATMQIEDHLEELATVLHKDESRAISELEKLLNKALNSKQRALIYEAILEENPRTSSRLAKKLIEKAELQTLRDTETDSRCTRQVHRTRKHIDNCRPISAKHQWLRISMKMLRSSLML